MHSPTTTTPTPASGERYDSEPTGMILARETAAPAVVAEVGPVRVETYGLEYLVTIGDTVIAGEAPDADEAARVALDVAVDELRRLARALEVLG